jgi:hypothetical protein
MKHLCPVCQIKMKPTANEGLFGCPTYRSFSMPGIKEKIPYWDTGILFGPNNNPIWQMYEIPPYRIYIYDQYERHMARTKIDKVILNPYGQGEGSWEYRAIFAVDGIVNFPLTNTKQVIEKIKLLVTFS